MSTLDIAPLTGALGAEIFGVDLAQTLPDTTIAAIRRALGQYGVVFFRDQTFDAEQHKAFARRFGPIFVHPNFPADRPDREIVVLHREPGDRRIVGEEWHTDTTMMAAPPMGAILYGVEIPPYGGDTLFSAQWLAYDALSDGMKKLLRGLRAIHSDRNLAGPRAGRDRNAQAASKLLRDDAEWQETQSVHPVVCVHPETGRPHLFVNTMYTTGFEGMTEEESAPLLKYLVEHGHRPEFTCRFRWRPGSVAFWDNRSTMHLAIDDAGKYLRIMRRVQVAGSAPIAAD